MGYVNDNSLAQDMAQETFIKVWQYLPTFRHEATLGTWIFRIATNTCLRQLEHQNPIIQATLPINQPEEEQTDIEPQIQLLYKLISELSVVRSIILLL